MDWGGTWMRVAVVDWSGAIRWHKRRNNPKDKGKDSLLAAGLELLRQAVGACSSHPVAGIGLAIAGPVDAEAGALSGSPQFPALEGVPLKALWEPELGLPIFLGNDANLAALGEYHHGAGQAVTDDEGQLVRTLVYATVSTGIGGGVVDRGELLLGAHGLAAEIGHMAIDWRPDAPPCFCGSQGCLESIASGTAIARAARQRRLEPRWRHSTSLSGLAEEAVTAPAVFQAAQAGDLLASQMVEEVVQALSVGLASVLHLYDPDLLVLGGGVTQGLADLAKLPEIQRRMRVRVMSDGYRQCPLVPAKLGDNVGLVGAACLVWQRLDAR